MAGSKKKKKTAGGKKKKIKRRYGSELVKRNVALWQLISPTNKNRQQRETLIQSLNKGQLDDISRMLRAFMNGKFKVTDGVIKKLKKDKQFLYCLADCKTPIEERKDIVRQKGGFLPFLLPLLIKGAVGGIAAAAAAGRRR